MLGVALAAKAVRPHPTLSQDPKRAPQTIAFGVPLYKATAQMEDRRFLPKLLAVEAAILMGAHFVLSVI
jgi:hypothetical protein